jgi:O-antigen ligase
MDFFFFLLLVGTLLVRPMEVIADLDRVPLYQFLILTCLVLSAPRVLNQLSLPSLRAQPMTVCVLGLLASVVLSHLSHGSVGEAWHSGTEFAKVVLFYLLIVATLTTRSRLRFFLAWLVGCLVVLVLLALLQYHGLIDVPSLRTLEQYEIDRETGDLKIVPRLQSMGIYNDPNDLAIMLAVGIVLSLYFITSSSGPSRCFWLPPIVLFTYSLVMTHSRGGFLAFLAGLAVLCRERFGWKKTMFLAGAGFPVLVLLLAGRQTSFSLNDREDTAQHRILLWSDGLAYLKSTPLFGIGEGRYGDEVGLVAHNSYVHAYVELGLLGGTLFVSVFYLAFVLLHRAGSQRRGVRDCRLSHLRSHLVAALASYAVGLLSLSRMHIGPTYLLLALVVVFVRLFVLQTRALRLEFNIKLVGRLGIISFLCLAFIHLFIQAFAHYG